MSHDDSANDPMNFVKNMWGNMGFSLPGMVTPTFDVEEIEKRVKDMKAVEGWLKMNLSMLQMTIQSLEMQCVTLNAVRTMGNMAASQPAASPAASTTKPAPDAGENATQASMWPWNLMQQMQDQMQQAAAEQAAGSAAAEESRRGGKAEQEIPVEPPRPVRASNDSGLSQAGDFLVTIARFLQDFDAMLAGRRRIALYCKLPAGQLHRG